MKKKICIIVNGYPTKDDPVYAFIQPVAREMADSGVSCTVIAPQSVSKMAVSNKAKRPYRWIDSEVWMRRVWMTTAIDLKSPLEYFFWASLSYEPLSYEPNISVWVSF